MAETTLRHIGSSSTTSTCGGGSGSGTAVGTGAGTGMRRRGRARALGGRLVRPPAHARRCRPLRRGGGFRRRGRGVGRCCRPSRPAQGRAAVGNPARCEAGEVGQRGGPLLQPWASWRARDRSGNPIDALGGQMSTHTKALGREGQARGVSAAAGGSSSRMLMLLIAVRAALRLRAGHGWQQKWGLCSRLQAPPCSPPPGPSSCSGVWERGACTAAGPPQWEAAPFCSAREGPAPGAGLVCRGGMVVNYAGAEALGRLQRLQHEQDCWCQPASMPSLTRCTRAPAIWTAPSLLTHRNAAVQAAGRVPACCLPAVRQRRAACACAPPPSLFESISTPSAGWA